MHRWLVAAVEAAPDTPAEGLFRYSYTIENLGDPGDGEIAEWRLPFFNDEATAISGAIFTPVAWLFEFVTADAGNWTYNSATDPNAGLFAGPTAVEFETPGFWPPGSSTSAARRACWESP